MNSRQFILILLVAFVSYTRACCPPGLVLLNRKKICWDPKTNVKRPVILQCEAFRFQNIQVKEDRTLLVILEKSNFTTDNEYCLANATTIQDVSLKNTTVHALVCSDEKPYLDERVLGYCLIVSVIFLIPTALVYTALPELRDVQGKSIINFCVSLALGEGILAVAKLLMVYTDMGLCATRGFLIYFFLLAAFFWTNAISIQVLLNTRRPRCPSTLDYSWYEFKWYFLYAWGCPTVLTVIMAIINFHPGDHSKPGIGLNHCWFYDKYQQWYYMYSVMALLLGVNFGIFIYTSLVIWRQSFSSSHSKALKYKMVMTARLIVLMGLPWVIEMVVGSVEARHILFAILDILNFLQGILIFLLLVVFRRRVIKLMYRHGWLDCMSNFIEKHLAVDDDEENVVQHTDVPISMIDRTT